MATDWETYYAALQGREPRGDFDLAKGLVPGDAERIAVDLGAGDGTETAALVKQGWQVLAVDLTPGLRERILERLGGDPGDALTTIEAPFSALHELPPATFVYAGFALPFATPNELDYVMALVAKSLAPNGVFGAHLLGERDSWTVRHDVLTHDAAASDSLFAQFTVKWKEREYDGPSGAGPKHWHVRFATATLPA